MEKKKTLLSNDSTDSLKKKMMIVFHFSTWTEIHIGELLSGQSGVTLFLIHQQAAVSSPWKFLLI